MNVGRSNLLASKNSNFVYAWWFQLDSTLKVGNAFFHIFQLKARPMEQNPIVTFQLKKDGLYLRIGHDPNTPDNVVYKKLLSLSAVVGRWIQAYVEVQYSTSSSGYVHVTLKDQNGAQLYDARVVGPTFPPTSQPQTIYPKWGLYHGNDNAYQSSDWELFQNIQIWKK